MNEVASKEAPRFIIRNYLSRRALERGRDLLGKPGQGINNDAEEEEKASPEWRVGPQRLDAVRAAITTSPNSSTSSTTI